MPDFDQLLSQRRNVLLNPRRTTSDIVRAGIQATTGVPYSEAIADIEARKFDQALRGYSILSAERDYQSRQDQQMWERAQAEAERGDENAARLLELAGAYGANAADAQRLAAAVVERTEAENIDDASALPGVVAAEAERLGLAARPDLAFMSTKGGGVVGIDPTGEARTIVEGQPSQDAGITIYGEGGEPLVQIGGPRMQAQAGGVPLTGSQTGKQGIEIAEETRAANTRISELNNALRSLEENPEAAGISGLVIENVGGVLQQLTDLAGIDSEWLPTEEVQATRTELASLLGQYIPTITGDESGRYSDQDMRRAQAALPASRATASYGQVRAALETLHDIELRSRMRSRMRADGFDPSIDITYRAGQEAYANQLMSEGKTLDEAADIIVQLFVRYGVSPEVVGIQ